MYARQLDRRDLYEQLLHELANLIAQSNPFAACLETRLAIASSQIT